MLQHLIRAQPCGHACPTEGSCRCCTHRVTACPLSPKRAGSTVRTMGGALASRARQMRQVPSKEADSRASGWVGWKSTKAAAPPWPTSTDTGRPGRPPLTCRARKADAQVDTFDTGMGCLRVVLGQQHGQNHRPHTAGSPMLPARTLGGPWLTAPRCPLAIRSAPKCYVLVAGPRLHPPLAATRGLCHPWRRMPPGGCRQRRTGR